MKCWKEQKLPPEVGNNEGSFDRTQALNWKVLAVLNYKIIMTPNHFYNFEKYSIFAPK